MSRICIISGDGHAGTKVSEYKDFMESKYWDALKEVELEEQQFLQMTQGKSSFAPEHLDAMDDRGAIRSGGQSGGWDPTRRVQEMDAEGVVAEIIHQGHQHASMPFFSIVNRPYPPEMRQVGAQAYHRWLANHMAATNGRTYGVADPGPCHDMAAAVKELHWAADNGFVSVGVPGILADSALPPLYDSYFEPFWAACSELNLVLSVHAGWGLEQGLRFKFADMMMNAGKSLDDAAKQAKFSAMDDQLKKDRVALGMPSRQVLWQLMLGGVFDRYPGLKLVFTEIRADWIPETLQFLDAKLADSNLSMRCTPSEYFARNCYVAPSSPRANEIAMRDKIGVDRFIFGSDYPHPEGTWPNTWDWLRTVFKGVPEPEVRMILAGNAFDCYNLDKAKLLAVAERIGPKPEDILDPGIQVKEAVINDFDRRSQFKAMAEVVDREILAELVENDVAGARTRALRQG